MIGSSLVPGALGGPWHWVSGSGYDQAAPPAALQQLSWAVALIVVIVTCAWRVRAWRAWVILLGWVVAADFVPVITGRLAAYPGSLLGAQTRYLTDATGILALCVGLAILPLAGEQDVYRFRFGTLRRPLVAATTALLCAGAIGAVWSLESLQSVSNATTATARSYIATAQAAPPGTVIVDSPVPAVIMDAGLFWNHALASDVIGAVAAPSQHLTWRRTLRGVAVNPMIFDGQGQLRSLTVIGQFSWPAPRAKTGPYAGRNCWNVSSARTTSVPLLGSVYPYAWTARVAYTGPASKLAVGFGGNVSTVDLTAGTSTAYLPLIGGGRAVTLQLLGGTGNVCVTGVTVGSPQPDKTGQAIPALPVPG
jgi:hypothetical protein